MAHPAMMGGVGRAVEEEVGQAVEGGGGSGCRGRWGGSGCRVEEVVQ